MAIDMTQNTKQASPLSLQDAEALLQTIPAWQINTTSNMLKLERTFTFSNFQDGLEFCNRIGNLAEQHDHHPLIKLQWGEVIVTWWTHSLNGLQALDFSLAAKTDSLFNCA